MAMNHDPPAPSGTGSPRAPGEGRIIETAFLGRVPYEAGLRLQDERVAAVRDRGGAEALFLLEHDPVLTLGRNASRRNITASPEALARLGITVHECGRGGDVTYHGPGQLVGYPVINLAPDRKDVWKYVRNLEEALIRTLADHGVAGRRFQGLTGVWVGGEKVAAIGVRVSRWVTSHGFALNVTTDLDHFRTIVPCGIRDYGVTSLQRLMESPPSLPAVAGGAAGHFAEIFGRKIRWMEPDRLAGGGNPSVPKAAEEGADVPPGGAATEAAVRS
jgi:lipoyl(octanoyl) transferase